ncbi:VOC family protein [Leeuwenhoekiella polynyae]|uniref:Catechol 2,3-dioxygenase-like lactoylglutathione lyase family enzyme n=1 Tax=Leeuwenhoekiella polynyae TaxID=1550906 RepID=A0A4Q0P1P2_9FLAO|nr:VOC family protein [Leeuwenhoekiella polynyae]RXG20008.1 catechol 2,3-dioxygenase-like lactoylglutathione lyase family enzyme [Leeuwenhoekiella polynyae]
MRILFSGLIFFALSIQALCAQTNFKSGALTAAVISSNSQQTLHFYRDILGLKDAGAFTIDAAFAERLGLSAGVPFEVTVLKFTDSPDSSQLKIVSFEEEEDLNVEEVKTSIQEQLGLQYLTLQVYSLDPIIARLKKEGILPEAETPIDLGNGSFLILLKDPDGVFVEVIGSLTL